MRLDRKAVVWMGAREKIRPRRTYTGNPGECGIPSVELTAEKAAESSQKMVGHKVKIYNPKVPVKIKPPRMIFLLVISSSNLDILLLS